MSGRIGWRGLKANEYTRTGPLFLSAYNLDHGKSVIFENPNHISQERYDESPEIKIKENDILLVKDGSGIGKVSIVKNLKSPSTVNSSLLVIRSLGVYDPVFLFYFFCGPALQNIAKNRITGSATPHLFQKDIKEFTLPIPPMEEQKEIARKLKINFDHMEQIEKIVGTLLKQFGFFYLSILKSAFSGKLVKQISTDLSLEKTLYNIKENQKNRN